MTNPYKFDFNGLNIIIYAENKEQAQTIFNQKISECKKKTSEFKITTEPFDWNDNFSDIALEDFSTIQKELPYAICQSIGMALAKLELLEKQGCKVEEFKEEDKDEE